MLTQLLLAKWNERLLKNKYINYCKRAYNCMNQNIKKKKKEKRKIFDELFTCNLSIAVNSVYITVKLKQTFKQISTEQKLF